MSVLLSLTSPLPPPLGFPNREASLHILGTTEAWTTTPNSSFRTYPERVTLILLPLIHQQQLFLLLLLLLELRLQLLLQLTAADLKLLQLLFRFLVTVADSYEASLFKKKKSIQDQGHYIHFFNMMEISIHL